MYPGCENNLKENKHFWYYKDSKALINYKLNLKNPVFPWFWSCKKENAQTLQIICSGD